VTLATSRHRRIRPNRQTIRPSHHRIRRRLRNRPDEPPAPPEDPQPPAQPPAVDTVPPSLKIFYPASTNVLTNRESIALRGTATDNVGVTAVRWSTNTGHEGAAFGLSYWRTESIPLLIGTNVITVHAFDEAGNDAWRTVMVTRR